MSGLTDQAGGETPQINQSVQQAHAAWEASMQRQLDNLRQEVAAQPAALVAQRCGAVFQDGAIHLSYWGQSVRIGWRDFQPVFTDSGKPCSVYDSSLLLYYLRISDGAPLADRWVSFRELPGGGFYHQAFQGYSGDRLARSLGNQEDLYIQAVRALGGMQLTGLSGLAYAFQPLPRFPLAALLWPGDEEFPARASILFDANACHYMIIDGCALLGSGLVSRLIKASKAS
jgi:hypothetical protein